jgi:hypothetical protein
MTDPHDPTFNHHAINEEASSASLLDEDRLASMADEGGFSGALMEMDDPGERRRLMEKQRRALGVGPWRTATAAFALVAVAAVAWGWLRRTA